MPVSDAETIHFNYWGVVAFLVQHGFSYESVQTMSESEVTVLMGTLSAMEQRKAQREARASRIGH